MRIEELDTPALILNYPVMESNLQKMADLCQKYKLKLRPHIKTHKMVEVALRQVELSGNGIAVAKLAEAEIMQQAGIDDILIANQVIGETKIRRLSNLLRKIRVSCSVDSKESITLLEKYLEVGKDQQLEVFIEIDTGLKRCGVTEPDDALELAGHILKTKKLNLKGIMSHSGNVYGAANLSEVKKIALLEIKQMLAVKQRLSRNGIELAEVSIGSTPAQVTLDKCYGVTEFRPGNYVFNDNIQLSLGITELSECALSIVTTVISRPEPNRAVIDAGSKALGLDKGAHGSELITGYGHVLEYPDIIISRLSEEHGILSLPKNSELQIGEKLIVIPNHSCSVTNLFDRVYVVQNGLVIDEWCVAARGALT